jgi:hypothetical protein
MHFNPYGGSAAQVAVRLVNAGTAGADVLVGHLQAEGVSMTHLSPAQARKIADWAARLRPVFLEREPTARVALVNELLAESACRPYISRHDGLAPHLHYASETADEVLRLRAYTAGGLAHLVCEDPDRMGACARPACDLVFVDTSRNGRRRFCSTRCATRTHVADHRKRANAH